MMNKLNERKRENIEIRKREWKREKENNEQIK